MLLASVALFIALNRQFVADQLMVWSYHPSSSVVAIADKVALTPEGRFAFYASQPEVADRDTFNQECPRQEAKSPILGCYTTDNRIYIYDVTNQKLDGIEEVTATHEMLHAVWQRQSATEKTRVTALLESAYSRIDDKSLTERMDYYRRVEPDEVTNELHSILGTEVSGLDSELEAYYSQYFNRNAVLALHGQYSAIYTSLNNRSEELYANIQALATSIERDSAQYTIDYEQLVNDINSFNRRADAGDFGSMNQFYTERSRLMNRSSDLEMRRVAINKDISQYDGYSSEYQSIASELKTLNSSLDSFNSLQEAPSV